MSDCQHEWAEGLSGETGMFMCLKCGKRVDADPLTAVIIKAEQQLGVPLDPTPLAVIEGAEMPLSWTAEKPAVSGWFWFQDVALEVGPVIVRWTGSTYSMAGIEGEFIPGDQSRWASPLEPLASSQ